MADIINFTNYKNKYGSGWFYSNDYNEWNGTVVVAAPNICTNTYVDSVALRKGNITVTAYYYNGSGWTQKWSKTISKSGNNDEEYKWSHNRAAESYPNQDNSNYHLWRFDVSGSCTGSSTYGFKVWCGGIGLYNDSEYNTYCKGQKIRYVAGDYWGIGGTYGSLDAFLNGEHPNVRRGTKITESNGKFVCASAI